jgi:septal ring factor EnvC (AmiA/AmiB activator)
MVDPAFSRQRYEEERAETRIRRRRMLAPALAIVALIGGGVWLVWALGTPAGATRTPPSSALDQASSQISALASTQQETVSRLRYVQAELAKSQSETKKLRQQLGEVTGKLDTLQSSIADMAARFR